MDYTHFVEEIKNNINSYSKKNALFYKDSISKKWIGISWNEFGRQASQMSKALLNFGIKKQDNIAIYSENMPKWIISDLAIMGIRAVTVPIYATNSKSEAEYIINDAKIEVLFAGEQEQYDNAIEILKTSKFLKLIVAFSSSIEISGKENTIYYKDFISQNYSKEIETEYQKRQYELELTDLASIIYTSGTTGEPKGVMLDHNNYGASLRAHDYELDVSENDTSLSFLPLSHIYERSWVFFCLHSGIAVYFNQDPKEIANVLQEVKPTIMCTVPRIFEKIYSAIQEKKREASSLKVKMMNWALKIGSKYNNQHLRLEKPVSRVLKLKYKIADKLVLRKLRDLFGGRMKFMPCGGAPLSGNIVAYFHSFGLNVKCGYGLTETTATVSLFGDTLFDFHSAGKSIHGVEIKIGDNDEILVKGPGVMKGYYKKPKETAEVFKDGWFCTGDAGKIDKYGNLTITDRIKDLMKTSGGKYIAPQKLETTLVNDSFIEQIAVIGDRQKYVTALAVPSFENLKKYAEEHKITFENIEDLLQHNKIIEMFKKRFEDLQKEFSKFEKIKKFTLLPKEFTLEAGEITATLKLKRKVILQKYKELIDKMYKD